MAKKEALRELQAGWPSGWAARTQQRGSSWLAVECSRRGILFPLRTRRVRSSPCPRSFQCRTRTAGSHGRGQSARAPARRGRPRRLQASRTAEASPAQAQQLVGFNQSLDLNCVLLVDRLAGLRGEEQLQREPDDGVAQPTFVGARYRDGSGRQWQELV